MQIRRFKLVLVPVKGFPNLCRLLQLAYIVPVANVAAESSFLSMRKIRTYIRSTMIEQRLSCIALLSLKVNLLTVLMSINFLTCSRKNAS